MKIENMNFMEAVKFLGEKVGVTIVEEQNAAYKARSDEKDLLYAVCAKAQDYFRSSFLSAEGAVAREYVQKRGLSPDMLERFGIGYSPRSWDGLLKNLTQQGYSAQLLEQAGLVIAREDKSGHYDRFRGRLMCPVTDARSRPVAFGGRILEAGQSNEPKYLNSPETPVFYKGKQLYAFPHAIEEIRRTKVAVVTEGYMDTITCHQFGFTNTVATLGTALTPDQAKILSRSVQEVILAYDADQAGQLAAERGISVLREAGLEVKIAKLLGKDPDEMLRHEGKDSFARALSGAEPFIKYLVDRALAKENIATPEGKYRASEAVVKILSGIEQEVLRYEYVRYSASQLRIKEEQLFSSLNKQVYFSGKRNAPSTARVITRPALSRDERAQRLILKAGLENAELRARILAEVSAQDITAGNYRELFMSLQNVTGDDTAWIDSLQNDELKMLARQLLLQEEPWTGKMIEDCFQVLREIQSSRAGERLRQELRAAEERGDHQTAKEILGRLSGVK